MSDSWNSAEQVARREAIARTRVAQEAAAENRRLEAEEKKLQKNERNRLGRLKATETRARNKQARLALEAAGWPRGWSPLAVGKWEAAGGSAAQAQTWTSRGFSPAELVQAASISGVEALPDLEDTARNYASLGDSLLDFVSNSWPIPPAGTIISIKSLSPDETRRRVCLATDEAGTIAWEWRCTSRDAGWGEATTWRAADTTTIAAAADSPLWIDTNDLSQVIGLTDHWLALLSVRGEGSWPGAEQWEETDAADWAQEVAYCEESAERVGARVLPVSLGSGGVLAASEYNGRELYFSLTEDEPLGKQLAAFWWHTESGSAPISWDGGDFATQVAPDLLLFHTSGDIERSPVLQLLPSTPEGVAHLLATWTLDIEAEVAAAISLEPLDPYSRLTDEARELWTERIDGFESGVSFDVEPPILDLIRAELHRSSSEYAAVAAALADPDGKGSELAEALDQNQGSSFAHV